MQKPIIELVNIVKSYHNRVVLDELSLTIYNGEFVTLLGPSGSGKTTILRLIGGFEWPTRGEIKFDGLDVKDLPAHKRFTNTIFQNYALFPHLNVEKNIQYGLKLRRFKLDEIPPKILVKLKNKEEEWEKKAKSNMKKLDKEQIKYNKIMAKNKKRSKLFKKAQKWLDNSDFNYSYWENYRNLKLESFEKKYMTRRISGAELLAITKDIIQKVRLQGFEKHHISELSGGMQQRVALARSIVNEPRVLLLDEPLSALDLAVRKQTQLELKDLHRRLKITFLLITHNQEEALELSDRVAVIRKGKIIQFDTPEKLYKEPINAWVANFIGNSNIFEGTVLSNNSVEVGGFKFEFAVQKGLKKDEKIDILIRPENLMIEAKKIDSKISGSVRNSTYKGDYYEIEVQSSTSEKIFLVNSAKDIGRGKTVHLNWNKKDIHIMKKEEGGDANVE